MVERPCPFNLQPVLRHRSYSVYNNKRTYSYKVFGYFSSGSVPWHTRNRHNGSATCLCSNCRSSGIAYFDALPRGYAYKKYGKFILKNVSPEWD